MSNIILYQMRDEPDSLTHYASKYYDPLKAHEYYMKHRKLKGRRTAGLNAEGREVAKIVKSGIENERKEKTSAHAEKTKTARQISSDETKTAIESERAIKKEEIARHKEEMQNSIDTLRSLLKSMSKEQKATYKEAVQSKIKVLREKNAAYRTEINEAYKEMAGKLREKHRAVSKSLTEAHRTESNRLRDVADETYEKEIAKLLKEKKYQSKNYSKYELSEADIKKALS